GNWTKEQALQLLRLQDLTDKSLIKLSNGETRRLAIAGALMKNPKLLLMEQPMTGLDVQTRQEFGRTLQHIVDSGIQVVMTTSPGEIPGALTHGGALKDGRCATKSRRDEQQLQETEYVINGMAKVDSQLRDLAR